MRPAPALVIFDCDGVLVDSEMLASAVMAEELTRLGHPHSPEECRRRFTGISLGDLRRLVEADGPPPLPDDFEETVRAKDRDAFARDLQPVAHVTDAIDTVRAANVAMCVASSGAEEKIRHSLAVTGLLERLGPHLFSAHMVANGKPAPDLFLHAAAAMGVYPSGAVVIEDSVHGVRAGCAAGMRVLGFAGASHCPPGHGTTLAEAGAAVTFDDMRTLPGLLGISD